MNANLPTKQWMIFTPVHINDNKILINDSQISNILPKIKFVKPCQVKGYEITDLKLSGKWENEDTEFNLIPDTLIAIEVAHLSEILPWVSFGSSNKFYMHQVELEDVDHYKELTMARSPTFFTAVENR